MRSGQFSVESYSSLQSLCWAGNNVFDLLAQHQEIDFSFTFSFGPNVTIYNGG
jgi:hypothetical protein